jgi:hypothetical protein
VHDREPPGSRPPVVHLRWPEEADRRLLLEAAAIPRLLIVDPSSRPPTDCADDEDWIRTDSPLEDRRRREAMIQHRVQARGRLPQPLARAIVIDEDGLARRLGRWVALTELEQRLVRCFLDGGGRAVSRGELLAAGWQRDDHGQRIVDGAVRRLRGKLSALGVSIHGIAGVGYLLDVAETLPPP